MNRKGIRDYARLLINELTEEPEGIISNEDLNILINVSIQKVELDVFDIAPWALRKNFFLSIEADKQLYDIEEDLEVTDFLIMEEILLNKTGEESLPLLYIDPDQIFEFSDVDETGEPELWTYDSAKVIALIPKPNVTIENFAKCFYFPELPDLNEDEEHDPEEGKYAIPGLPKVVRPLISLDVVSQIHIIGEEEQRDIKNRYDSGLIRARNLLSMRQGTQIMERPSIREIRQRR